MNAQMVLNMKDISSAIRVNQRQTLNPCLVEDTQKLFSQAVDVSRNLVKILNLNQSTNTHVICVHLLVLRWNILDHTKNNIW